MLRPADIEERDFLVVVHGYHKREVRDFLTLLAGEYASLLAQLEQPDDGAEPDFDSMGAQIAGVLRAAKEAAAAMTSEADDVARHAHEQAEAIRVESERAADEHLAAAEAIRAEAEAALADARRDAESLRAAGAAELEAAREEAIRVEREAEEQVQARRIEAEADVRTRLDVLHGHEDAIRARLDELSSAVRGAVDSLDIVHANGHVDLAESVRS